MNFLWFLRMARWSKRPPSMQRVILVFAIAAACLTLFLIERYIGLPEWMSLEPARRGRGVMF